VLVATLVLSGVALGQAARLRLSASHESMLPADSPQLADLKQVRQATGGLEKLVVVVRGGTAAERLNFVGQLAPRLRALPGVQRVETERAGGVVADRSLWLLDLPTLTELADAAELTWRVYEKEQHLAAWAALGQRARRVFEGGAERLPPQGPLASRDGRSSFLVVQAAVEVGDVEGGRQLLEAIERTAAELTPASQGLEVRCAGQLAVYREQHHQLRRDLGLASCVALLLGVILMVAWTRRVGAPLLIVLSLLPGLAWTFAIVRMFQVEVNIITGFLVAVLVGLGLDHGIHLLLRWREETGRPGSGASHEAIARALAATWSPAWTSGLTTAAAFLCFCVAKFPGFREFGWVAATGVVLTLVSTLLVMPPLLQVVYQRRRPTAPGPLQPSPTSASPPSRLALTVSVLIVSFFVGLAWYGAQHLAGIEFSNDFKILRGSSGATRLLDEVTAELGEALSPAVFVVPSVKQARRATAIARRGEGLGSVGAPNIGRVLSISDLLPDQVPERQAQIHRLAQVTGRAVKAVAEVETDESQRLRSELRRIQRLVSHPPWTLADLPEALRARLSTVDGSGFMVLVWPDRRLHLDRDKLAWEERLSALSLQLEQAGISQVWADEMVVNGWVSALVWSDRQRVVPCVVIALLALLLLRFRSVTHSLLLLAPVTVGLLSFFGMLHALGLELNLFNMIIVPVLLGIGLDGTVHVSHRYQAEGLGTAWWVAGRTGRAVGLAVATTAVGFGSSLLCQHAGLRSLGVLALLGLGLTLCSSLLFFPASLTLREAISLRLSGVDRGISP
jgi:predicted RND superfamily exporter protein